MRRKIIYNLVSGDLYFVLKPDCISIKNGVKKKVSAATVENQLVGPICLSYNKIKNELEPTSMENLLLGIAYHELMHKVSYKDDTRKIPHHVQTFVDSHLTLFEPTQESVLTFSQFFFPWVEKYEILVKRAIKNDKKLMVDHIKKLKTEYANSFNNSQINATLILSQKSGLLFPKTVLKIEEWLSKISQLDVNQDQQTLRKEILNRSKELLGITLNLFRATSNFRLMSLSFMNYIEMHLELVNQLADSNAETSTNNNTNTIVDSKDNNKVPSNAKATSFTHPICELNYYGRTTKKFSLETIDYLQFEGWSSRDYSDYKNGYNARCLIENGNDRDQVSPVAICFRRKIDAYNWDIALTPRKDQYLKFNPSLLYITELGSEETQFSMTHDFLGFINRGHNEKIEMELTDSMDRTEIQLKCKYPDVEIPKVEELFNDFSK